MSSKNESVPCFCKTYKCSGTMKSLRVMRKHVKEDNKRSPAREQTIMNFVKTLT